MWLVCFEMGVSYFHLHQSFCSRVVSQAGIVEIAICFKRLELKGIALPKTWSLCTECEAEPALWEDLRACDVHFDIQLSYAVEAVDCLKLIYVDFFTLFVPLRSSTRNSPDTTKSAFVPVTPHTNLESKWANLECVCFPVHTTRSCKSWECLWQSTK